MDEQRDDYDMSHYAQVEQGIVTRLIVAEAEVLATGLWGEGWVQTSYNTHGGIHAHGGAPLRKNYAGMGYTYDRVRDAFIPPQTYPSWVLNDVTCLWEAPVAKPDPRKLYNWDEATVNWIERLPSAMETAIDNQPHEIT